MTNGGNTVEKYYILTKEEADYEHHQKNEQLFYRNINTGAQYVDFLDGELLLLDGIKIGKLKHWRGNKKEIEILRKVFEIKDIEEKELYILYNEIQCILRDNSIQVHTSYVGNYFTSLDMAGITLTIMKVDQELKECIDYEAYCMGLKQFKR